MVKISDQIREDMGTFLHPNPELTQAKQDGKKLLAVARTYLLSEMAADAYFALKTGARVLLGTSSLGAVASHVMGFVIFHDIYQVTCNHQRIQTREFADNLLKKTSDGDFISPEDAADYVTKEWTKGMLSQRLIQPLLLLGMIYDKEIDTFLSVTIPTQLGRMGDAIQDGINAAWDKVTLIYTSRRDQVLLLADRASQRIYALTDPVFNSISETVNNVSESYNAFLSRVAKAQVALY